MATEGERTIEIIQGTSEDILTNPEQNHWRDEADRLRRQVDNMRRSMRHPRVIYMADDEARDAQDMKVLASMLDADKNIMMMGPSAPVNNPFTGVAVAAKRPESLAFAAHIDSVYDMIEGLNARGIPNNYSAGPSTIDTPDLLRTFTRANLRTLPYMGGYIVNRLGQFQDLPLDEDHIQNEYAFADARETLYLHELLKGLGVDTTALTPEILSEIMQSSRPQAFVTDHILNQIDAPTRIADREWTSIELRQLITTFGLNKSPNRPLIVSSKYDLDTNDIKDSIEFDDGLPADEFAILIINKSVGIRRADRIKSALSQAPKAGQDSERALRIARTALHLANNN